VLGDWPPGLARFPAGPPLDEAACRTADAGLFFPARGESATDAKAVCASCRVQPACLAFALAVPALDGVWGGRTARERKRIRLASRATRAGECHDGDVDPVVAVELEPAVTNGHMPEPEAAETVGTRACVGCGADLSDRREATRWCSETCRSRYRKRSVPAVGSQPAPVTIAQDRRNGHRLGPDTPVSPGMSWQPLVRALLDCGAQVSFTVDSIHFVAIRMETR
jgi:hypothetical protein